MGKDRPSGAFWSWGISGLVGAAIGAAGMLISQKQANTAENHFYMELDQMRHAAFLNPDASFEDKLDDLMRLQSVRRHGFRRVFEQNLASDIAEIEDSLKEIQRARQQSEAAAARARQIETTKAAEAAQARKEQAVRTNPLIFENCGGRTNILCP